MSNRKCVVKSKEYTECYVYSTAVYGSDLYKAKIFDEDEIPEYYKNSCEEEIIFLDSEKGIELLKKEFNKFNSEIPEMERKLNEMKKGKERLEKIVKNN
jgi:hypothetical protein